MSTTAFSYLGNANSPPRKQRVPQLIMRRESRVMHPRCHLTFQLHSVTADDCALVRLGLARQLHVELHVNWLVTRVNRHTKTRLKHKLVKQRHQALQQLVCGYHGYWLQTGATQLKGTWGEGEGVVKCWGGRWVVKCWGGRWGG